MVAIIYAAVLTLFAVAHHGNCQTIDQLILLSQSPSDARKTAAMQSPNSETVMVELDMVYKKETWEEMQRSRIPIGDEYDYEYDYYSKTEDESTDTESTETESTETESTDTESTDTESTETDSTDSWNIWDSTDSETEDDWDTRTETESGPGHRGHHHKRGRGRGRGGRGHKHGHGHSHSHGRESHESHERGHRGRGRHGHHGSRGRGGRHDRHRGRENENPRRYKRKAIRPLVYRWTNKEVPYEIGPGFTDEETQQIMASIRDYGRYTCLKFPQRGSRTNYVNIVRGSGCSSLVGMTGGAQALNLGNGCRVKSVILHELGHAIGFQHEQTRPDRDGFVRIHSQNIYSGMEYNFDRYDTTKVNDYSIPYDYRSIMHYGQYAFSVNGEATIVTSDKSYQNIIGKAQGLSFRDIKLANIMYQCNETCSRKITCPSGGFQGKDCKCYCKGNPIKECDETEDQGGDDEDDTTDDVLCSNFHPLCSAWAAVGECGLNPDYMLKYCQQACDACGVQPTTAVPECRDNDRYCPYWAGNNHCTNRAYKAYMEINCARSCGVCWGTSTRTTTAPAECKDLHNLRCRVRKFFGECRRNTSYMHRKCRKMCGYC